MPSPADYHAYPDAAGHFGFDLLQLRGPLQVLLHGELGLAIGAGDRGLRRDALRVGGQDEAGEEAGRQQRTAESG